MMSTGTVKEPIAGLECLEPPVRPSRGAVAPGLFALAIGAISGLYFVLATWNNDFHYQQHPDEPSKVEQVLENTRNLRHPLLMLNATALAARVQTPFIPKRFESRYWLAKRFTPNEIALLGRHLSAAFVAAGIFCAGLSLVVSGRPVGGVFAALFLSLNQTVIWVGHFFKEDASLLFGAGFYLLTASLALERPNRSRYLLVGLAAGLLLSAKWIGIVMLLGHWLVLYSSPGRRPSRRLSGWMLAAMAATFAVVNHQLWTGIPTAANSLGSEFSRLSGGRQGGLAFLHSYRFWFVDLLTREPGTLILPPALFGVYLAISGRTRAAVGLAVSFFGSYLLILGFTPIPSQRYFVPAVFGMLYFAGLGTGAAAAAALNERKGPVRAGWIVGLSTYLVFTLGIALRDTRIQSQDFADPGLPAAWHWIRQNLAGQPVVLAQIGRNHLPGAGRLEDPDTEPLPGEILPFDPKTATYDSIKALGITHLIFRSIDRGDSLRNRGLGSDFFRELDSRGKLVFLVPQGGVSIIQPGIEVHEIH